MIWVCHCFKPTGFLPAFTKCYTPEWADKLYRGLARNLDEQPRMVCFTDYEHDLFEEPIELARFTEEPSWLARMETFRPDMLEYYDGEPITWLDLDTVIIGDMTDVALYDGHFALLKDSGRGREWGSTIVSCDAGVGAFIWQAWQHTRKSHPNNSEMLWMRKHLDGHIRIDSWDEMAPGQMLSYKNHVLKRADMGNARMIYFHGKPKPHEVTEDFVREHWI